jgi:hypothetical protein
MVHAREMENALFLVQDIYSPEEALLPGGGFDFTNMAFIAESTSLSAFPALLQQVHRLCRPGGLMRWVEMEPPGTNSEAYGRLTALARQALLKAGLGLPTSIHTTGIAQVMGQLLRAAGFEEVHSAPHEFVIAADKGSRTHFRFFRQASVACLQMRAFLLAMGVTFHIADAVLLLPRQRKRGAEYSFKHIWLTRAAGATWHFPLPYSSLRHGSNEADSFHTMQA